MQKPAAHGKVTFPGNITLDSNLLESELEANWNAQVSCNSSGACNVQNHDLEYTHVESGSCDKKCYPSSHRGSGPFTRPRAPAP